MSKHIKFVHHMAVGCICYHHFENDLHFPIWQITQNPFRIFSYFHLICFEVFFYFVYWEWCITVYIGCNERCIHFFAFAYWAHDGWRPGPVECCRKHKHFVSFDTTILWYFATTGLISMWFLVIWTRNQHSFLEALCDDARGSLCVHWNGMALMSKYPCAYHVFDRENTMMLDTWAFASD